MAFDVLNVIKDNLTDLPNMRLSNGISNRSKQIMTWRLPDGDLVQMYINPQNIKVNESKQIQTTRTKGGFVLQYWGDNLTTLGISGTTGSSGIKGINVIRDVYHSENRAFEKLVSSEYNELFDVLDGDDISNIDIGTELIPYVSRKLTDRNFIIRPSMGSLAVGVVMYYQEVQYRGFFTEMNYVEEVNKLGMFDYNLSFTVTEIRGRRNNFMPWHREPKADDATGKLVNIIAGSVGLNPQQFFHPEDAPSTFGGNSLASQFGVDSSVIPNSPDQNTR